MPLLPEAAPPVHEVAEGLAGCVILAGDAALKLQCVARLPGSGRWWSRGWRAQDLPDLVDATTEVVLMLEQAAAGVAPAFLGCELLAPSALPAWLPAHVLAKAATPACQAVLVTKTARVGGLEPSVLSVASVQGFVAACAARGIVLADFPADNFGQVGGRLLGLDWGRPLRLSNPQTAARLTAAGLLDLLAAGAAPPEVLAWLHAAAAIH